jgi:transcriptional regulator with PAS, ATPase and Fis domain
VTREVTEGLRTLRLTLPDERISAAHARLERQGAAWTLTDLASTNGSFLRGAQTTSATLEDGDVVELGRSVLRFRSELSAAASSAGDADASALCGMAAAFGTLLPSATRDLETLARIARSDVPVLLTGETGTGKEVLARAIHQESRRPGELVAVNCAALPATLFESLLFGHKKGAFSGAVRDELGFVRAAQGGTLFLDEVGDLPPHSQAALLRVLQEREVVPVGATRPVPVDARVVAATHRPLEQMVAAGAFRQDLWARLSAYVHAVPPLRDRLEDLGVLVAAILRKVAGDAAGSYTFGPDAARALVQYDWPLNVRELEQALRVGALLAVEGRIERLEITPKPVSRAARSEELSTEDEALRRDLVAKLQEHRGNVTRVSHDMQKARMQIHRWLQRFGLDPAKFRK